jgi:hypothetical protein
VNFFEFFYSIESLLEVIVELQIVPLVLHNELEQLSAQTFHVDAEVDLRDVVGDFEVVHWVQLVADNKQVEIRVISVDFPV